MSYIRTEPDTDRCKFCKSLDRGPLCELCRGCHGCCASTPLPFLDPKPQLRIVPTQFVSCVGIGEE